MQEASRGDDEAAKLRLKKLDEVKLLDATDEALQLVPSALSKQAKCYAVFTLTNQSIYEQRKTCYYGGTHATPAKLTYQATQQS